MAVQKFHTVLAWLLLLLLGVHTVLGGITLLAPVHVLQGVLPAVFLALVIVHAALSLYKVGRGKKLSHLAAYPKENRRYWIRVLSGAAVLVLVLIHRLLWTVQTPFGKLLKAFEWPSLLVQLLFVAVLAVHILLNLRPLLLDSGIDGDGRLQKGLRALFSALVLAAAAAAVVYFLRGVV